MTRRIPDKLKLPWTTLFVFLLLLAPAYAGGVNSESLANNNLLNTFRDLDANQPSLLIQNGVVDLVSDGDPFVTTPQTFGPNFVENCQSSSASSIRGSRFASFAFDGDTGFSTFWESSNAQTFPQWVQCDRGSGNTKIARKLRISHLDTYLKDFIFQGSNNGSTFTNILTDATTGAGFVFHEYEFPNSDPFSIFRILGTSNARNGSLPDEIAAYEIEIFEEISPGGISPVISTAITAKRQPETCHLLLFEEDVETINLNTDLKAFCSRDNGVTWTNVELADEGNYDTGKRMLSGTGRFDDDVPAGTSMSYKLEKTNKDFNVHGIGFEWD
jgi:hypothetical protein